MHVIGTAGHVDHGKTTLIEAMTGINPDRLPEEKARGMTIDLGFAWFAGADGEAIGVIDVPGHERFIRNMVAGAWSLDCALLLVAADDGWMQQTQDHAIVLAALAVPAVILVVTKTDAVQPDRVEAVRKDALARCARIFGHTPAAVEVAAPAGRNVDALKKLIVATLGGLGDRPEPRGFSYLYVDRVFSVKGSGLVVTGSLKGGPCRRDDELVLLPQGENVRVRGLQTYMEAVDEAEPTTRLALNLPKTHGEIARGNCLASRGAPFHCERKMVARIVPVLSDRDAEGSGEEGKTGIRNHSEVEVALGTGHEIAQLHYLEDRRFAMLELRESLPALWNQGFLLIRHGGSEIIGTGRALWFGEVPREDRRRLSGLLASLPEPVADPEDRLLLELRFFGFLKTTGTLPERVKAESVVLDRWAFHVDWLGKTAAAIRELAAGPAGISSAELEGKLHLDGEALKRMLSILVERAELVASKGLYFVKSAERTQELSALGRRLVAEIEDAGRAGFEPGKSGVAGVRKELNALIRLDLVVPLEGDIFYGRRAYDALAAEILRGRTAGERFSIPEAKERTGLSRKFMIPLLNRMEKDGMLRRDGDVRVAL
jgi:selenocysteine-specific elongation factor